MHDVGREHAASKRAGYRTNCSVEPIDTPGLLRHVNEVVQLCLQQAEIAIGKPVGLARLLQDFGDNVSDP
jgi:hypothetical protein